MVEVILSFETQVQADDAVVALSKAYKVKQWVTPVTAGNPYCVSIQVSSEDVITTKD